MIQSVLKWSDPNFAINIKLVAIFLGYNQYVLKHLKAQLAVVLVLNCIRRRGHGLKSHPSKSKSRESTWGLPGTRQLRQVTNPLHHGVSLLL